VTGYYLESNVQSQTNMTFYEQPDCFHYLDLYFYFSVLKNK